MRSVRAYRATCAGFAATALLVALTACGADGDSPAAEFSASSLPEPEAVPVVEDEQAAKEDRAVPRASRSSIRSKGPHKLPPIAMPDAACTLQMPQGVWKLDTTAARTLAMLTAVAYREERPIAKVARAFEHSLRLRYRTVPTPLRARDLLRRNEYQKGGLTPHTWAVDATLAMYGRAALACAHPVRSMPAEEMLTNGLTLRAQTMIFAFFDSYGGRILGGFDPEGIASGHIENSAHYDGRAVDVSFPRSDPDNKARGWLLSNWLVASADHYSIATVIFDDRVWSLVKSQQGWRPYVHPSGNKKNPTLRHLDHIHVDVVNGKPQDTPNAATEADVESAAAAATPSARRPAAPAKPERPAQVTKRAPAAKKPAQSNQPAAPDQPAPARSDAKPDTLPQGVLAPPKVPKAAPAKPGGGPPPGPPAD